MYELTYELHEFNLFTLYLKGLCWRRYDQSARHPCAGVGQSAAHPDVLLPVKSCHHTSGDGSRTYIPPCAAQLLWYVQRFLHVVVSHKVLPTVRTRVELLCLPSSGPGVNKAVLLQLQQSKAKARDELEISNNNQAYENMTYENNEIKQNPDLKSPKVFTDTSRPSGTIENQQGAKVSSF